MSPDGSTNPLPEEKLLNLIRAQQAARPVVASTVPAGGARGIAGSTGARQRSERGIRWVKPVVGCLSLVLVVEAIALILQFTRPLPAVGPPVLDAPSIREPTAEALPSEALPVLAESVSRPLFAPAAVGVPSSQGSRTSPSASGKSLAARLTLTGIVAGDPAQAIIEDAETKKTYFVTVGQMVVDGAVLKQVLDNRVVLDLDGEKIELSL